MTGAGPSDRRPPFGGREAVLCVLAFGLWSAVAASGAGGRSAPEAPAPVYHGEQARIAVGRAALAAPAAERVRHAVVETDRAGSDPRGVVVDAGVGRIYWTEHGTGRIRSARLDGGDVRDVVAGGLDGPIGLALDPSAGRLYWSSDRDFPRRIQSMQLGSGQIEDLVVGEDVNRPGGIAVDGKHGKLYWLESVSGRVRRANVDGSSIDELHEQRLLAGFGIALDLEGGRLYWTDLANSTLQAADLEDDGLGDVVTLLGPDDELDAPTGLALDAATGQLYFADAGARKIRRTNRDGSFVEDVLTARDGLIEPRGLAIDAGRIYFADQGTDSIGSAKLDGSDVRTLVALGGAFGLSGSAAPAETDGSDARTREASCKRVVEREGPRYVRDLFTRASICLDKLMFTKAVKWRAGDMASGAATCLAQLAPLGRTGAQAADAELVRRLRSGCVEESASARAEAVAAAPFLLERDARACASASDAGGWVACVAGAYERVAWEAIAIDYPRALEYLEEIRPFAARAAVPSAVAAARADGVAGLDRMRAQVADIVRSRSVAAVAGAPFPASGLTTAYGADKDDGVAGSVPVADDGTVRAGVPMRLVDNGDGTVSDLTTGLMWEKKCDDCGGLHDAMIGYRWSGNGSQETIWDWLDDVNAEGGRGFAGHDDWRLPNPKELLTIVDYERFNPAVSAAFDGASCGLGCSDLRDPACSCTAQGNYWTSTTFSDFPAHAYVVSFHLGLVADQAKTDRFFVRAVRGGPQVQYER